MDLRLEPFKTTVIIKAKYYPMWVEQTLLSADEEQFRLIGGKKEAILANNRPALRKQNNMSRELAWRDVTGKFEPEVFNHIIRILEIEIYAREYPEVSWTRIMLGKS